MYNTLIRFDGDIIITDPCYVMRHGEDQFIKTVVFEKVEDPQQKDYYSYIRDNGVVLEEDYPDCIMIDLDDPRVDPNIRAFRKDWIGFMRICGDWSEEEITEQTKVAYSEQYQKENSAFHTALIKYCECNPRDDWDYCDCGYSMEKLGFETFLCDSTVYGDWSCTTFNSDTKEPIGEFCADAGEVAVFLLDEVLKYNPNFDYHVHRPWTTTLIKDFHGTVELHLDDDKEVTVVGRGNINFVGTQTGI